MKKYLGVIYLRNGDACVSRPCDTEEQCVEAMKKAVERDFGKVLATTYMVRDMADGDTLMAEFGHPRSRDLMQDAKFIRGITK